MRVQAHELSQSSNSNSLSIVPLAFVYPALGLFSYQSSVPSPLPHRGAGTPDQHMPSELQISTLHKAPCCFPQNSKGGCTGAAVRQQYLQIRIAY